MESLSPAFATAYGRWSPQNPIGYGRFRFPFAFGPLVFFGGGVIRSFRRGGLPRHSRKGTLLDFRPGQFSTPFRREFVDLHRKRSDFTAKSVAIN